MKDERTIHRYRPKRKKGKERRLEDIYEYIEEHPGVTAYQLSKVKYLNLNKETARQSLMELEQKGDIFLVEEIVEGRRRKNAFLKPLDEYIFTEFNEANLKLPEIQSLVQKARRAGYEIIIIRNDGSKISILPNESLDQKLGLSS